MIDYEEQGRKADEQRTQLEREKPEYHTPTSFLNMMNENNKKWKTVNDRFMDGLNKCAKEIIGDDCKCPQCIEDSVAEAEYREDR